MNAEFLTGLIGIVAGLLTTLSGLPLARYVHRTGYTRDLDLRWLLMLLSGCSLFVLYGALRNDMPLALANLLTGSIFAYLTLKKLQEQPEAVVSADQPEAE